MKAIDFIHTWTRQDGLPEKCAVFVVLALYCALQTNAILHKNYAGQDFQSHKQQIEESARDPLTALTRPLELGGGIPTLYHYIGGRVFNLVQGARYLEVLALGQLVLNSMALLLFYKLMRALIRGRIVRVSCFILISFLPAFVIPAIVISSDAMMSLLFVVIVWLIIGLWRKARTNILSILIMLALSGVLLVSFNIKFNSGASIVAVFFLTVVFLKNEILNLHKFFCAVVLLVLLPLSIISLQYEAYINKQIWQPGQGTISTVKDFSRMNLRSMVFFRRPDSALLTAPYFHEYKDVKGRLTQPIFLMNYYSYPGLLHLALFTDVMNIYQPIHFETYDPLTIERNGPKDEYMNRLRTEDNQQRMSLAVKTGIPFFFGMLLIVPWLTWSQLRKVFFRKEDVDYPLLILMTTSVIYYLLTLGHTLSQEWSYVLGGWLPRQVAPALLSFFVLLFVGIDKCLARRPVFFQWVLLSFVIFQSCLHFSFLWVQ